MARRPPIPMAARAAILAHFDAHGRDLAFRRTRDPWAILVSEAMAQQTQATRAAERWERFMARFPTVEALAAATPADVLREWQGLGYDRRGLALWRAARRIVEDHGGRVPASIEALEALPGVGPYTARAVAALAFGMPVGAVDVNVRRVLGRIATGSAHGLSPRELQVLADAVVPPDRPGAWTHAVMDVGATSCRPRSPRCEACPARAWCRYAREGGAGESVRAGTSGSAEAVGAAGDVAVGGRAGGTAVDAAVGRSPRPPFHATNRWLRGRILDRLRSVPDDGWAVLPDVLGVHDAAAIDRALRAMARDGVLELRPGPTREARLPTG